MAFTLGNLTSSNDKNREELSNLGLVEPLLDRLSWYSKRYCVLRAHQVTATPREGLPDQEREKALNIKETTSVLTKLVRLTANMAIQEDIGQRLLKEEATRSLIYLLGESASCSEPIYSKAVYLSFVVFRCVL